MSFRGQPVKGCRGKASLNKKIAPSERALAEASCIQRSLDIHVEVHNIRDKLCVRLSLIKSSHDPERYSCITFLHEPRKDGCKRPLTRSQGVRLSRLQRKTSAPILQDEASLGRDQTASKIACVALNKRDLISVTIHDGKICGIAG